MSVYRGRRMGWAAGWGPAVPAAALCVLLTGCLHRVQVPPLPPQAKTPSVYLPPPPELSLPPMGSPEPPPNLTDAKPAAAQAMKPKRHSRRSASPPAAASGDPQTAPSQSPSPTPVAPPAVTPAATLGALSPGGGAADPRQQQEVLSRIAAVERRIGELPRSISDRQEKQIANARLFLKEASDALKGGDVEGAGILATKADLLIDDLSR